MKLQPIQRRSNGAPQPRRDWCTQTGAYDLSEEIRQFWEAKGHRVQVEIEPFHQNHRADVFMIRSNLVNGMPPR